MQVQVAVGREQASGEGFIDAVIRIFLRNRLARGLGGFMEPVAELIAAIWRAGAGSQPHGLCLCRDEPIHEGCAGRKTKVSF